MTRNEKTAWACACWGLHSVVADIMNTNYGMAKIDAEQACDLMEEFAKANGITLVEEINGWRRLKLDAKEAAK